MNDFLTERQNAIDSVIQEKKNLTDIQLLMLGMLHLLGSRDHGEPDIGAIRQLLAMRVNL